MRPPMCHLYIVLYDLWLRKKLDLQPGLDPILANDTLAFSMRIGVSFAPLTGGDHHLEVEAAMFVANEN